MPSNPADPRPPDILDSLATAKFHRQQGFFLAAGRLAEARKKLARGKSEEGLAALRDIVRTFNGFPAANDARTILAQLTNARRAVRDQARRP